MRYLLILLLLIATPATAHKVIAGAYAAGENLEGEVGFSNGAPAIGVTILITGPEGEALGEVITDEDGFFVFTPTLSVPHYFFGDLGSGHVAKFEIPVNELPRALAGDTVAPIATPTSGPNQPVLNADIAELVAAAVRDEIRPLRRELIASREKATFQSIIGGVGFILGMFGIGFYFAAKKREGKHDK